MKKNLNLSRMAVLALVLALGLGGCSWFKKDEVKQPVEAPAVKPVTPPIPYLPSSTPSRGIEGEFSDVNFDYDSYALREDAKDIIKSNFNIFVKYPTIRIEVEGHCDERGTNEYNMALGKERANAVVNYLVSLGVASSRLQSISYGEEIPLDRGHTEAAWAKNRRAHFHVVD